MKKTRLLSLVGTLGLSLLAQPTQAALALLSDMQASDPVVNLYPGDAPVIRTSTVGQLIEVQIRYPIAPPFPQSADIVASRDDRRLLNPVGVYRVPSPASADGGPPLLGVGYLGAWIKMTGTGQAHCSVRIRMSDGTLKKIPLIFDIQTQQ